MNFPCSPQGGRLRRRSRALGTTVATLLTLIVPGLARAQAEDAPATAPAAGTQDPAPAAPAPAANAGTPDLAKLAAELEEQKKELAAQKAALEEAQKSVEDLHEKADSAASEDSDWTHKFKIYGFTDVGLNRVWVDDRSLVGQFVNSANATSFVIGNLNFYFDAQPIKNWRSLVELRFTNAPHGEIANLGGLAGQFKRVSTRQVDPHGATVAGEMWGGYSVIERAHIDWTPHELVKIRVGNWFTPFGIWNVDHGMPTLIAVQLPGFIQTRQMPLRQTGIQVYGNTFSGDWELGYTATISNGRQELSNFAFDDNRGFGGRLYANNEKGETNIKVGASFYTGRVRDEEVVLKAVNPLTVERRSTYDAREIVGGIDASIDVGRTRIRAEGAMSSVEYDPGKHQATGPAEPGVVKPNRIATSGYLLAAHTLPFAPIEGYASVDALHGPIFGLGDLVVAPSAGINIRFTKATMLKTQVTHTFLLDTRGKMAASELSQNNTTYLFTRLVLVF